MGDVDIRAEVADRAENRELIMERTTVAMWFKSNLVKALTFLLGGVILVCASPVGAQGGGNVNWSSKLHLKSLSDISNRLHEPVFGKAENKLSFTNGKSARDIHNCDEYLNAVSIGFYPEGNYDNKEADEFVYQCYVLRDLQGVRPVTPTHPYTWSKDSLAELPPVLVPGSRERANAAAQAEKRSESWQQFDPGLHITKIDPHMLFADDGNYAYSLEILARGDFNGDGVEDIAVYGTAIGKHGTWSSAEYFVLSPTSSNKFVRLTQGHAPYRLKAQIPE